MRYQRVPHSAWQQLAQLKAEKAALLTAWEEEDSLKPRKAMFSIAPQNGIMLL